MGETTVLWRIIFVEFTFQERKRDIQERQWSDGMKKKRIDEMNQGDDKWRIFFNVNEKWKTEQHETALLNEGKKFVGWAGNQSDKPRYWQVTWVFSMSYLVRIKVEEWKRWHESSRIESYWSKGESLVNKEAKSWWIGVGRLMTPHVQSISENYQTNQHDDVNENGRESDHYGRIREEKVPIEDVASVVEFRYR